MEIIPLREIIGNYNFNGYGGNCPVHYTLERDNRELQPSSISYFFIPYYTLERDNRELQRYSTLYRRIEYYTLERDNRELQLWESSII